MEWVKGDYLVVERNPNYWMTDADTGQALPYLDEVIFKFAMNQTELLDAFAAREADIVAPDATDAALVFLHDLQVSGADAQVRSGPVWEHLNFSLGPGRLSRNPQSMNEHRRFRQAIAYGVNGEAIVADLYNGMIDPLDSYLAPYSPTLTTNPWMQYNDNPGAAKDLLEILCTDLIRDCVADPIPVVFTTTNNDPKRIRVAELLEPMLESASDGLLDVTVELEGISTFLFTSLTNGTWDFGMFEWTAGPSLATQVGSFDHFDPAFPTPGLLGNPYRWGTPDSSVIDGNTAAFATHAADARGTVDVGEIHSLLGQAEQILADDAVIIPLYARPLVGAVWADEVAGYKFNTTQAYHTWNMAQWYRVDDFALPPVPPRVCDFDGDGLEEVVVSSPGQSVDGKAAAGTVTVADGAHLTGPDRAHKSFHQNTPGISGATAEANDRFGTSLACGDFNGDGYADLAIGVEHEAIGSRTAAGIVHVLHGSSTGLRATNSEVWHQNTTGIIGTAEAGDRFGASLAVGDFNKDGISDLAVGVPGEAIGTKLEAGMINVIHGSTTGLTATGDSSWYQGVTGPGGTKLRGSAEAGDRFGAALAAADLNDDGHDELIASAPGEALGSLAGAGMAQVIFGAAGGLTDLDNQVWHQNTSDINGKAEAGDHFGEALVTGDFDGDTHVDVAFGVPGEAIGALAGAGMLNVIYGSTAGLVSDGDQSWHQNTGGIAGGSEAGDAFGSALASADFDGNGADDLAVGVPFEAVGTTAGAGIVHVIYGVPAAGLGTTVDDDLWRQGASGLPELGETGDHFGAALGVAHVAGAGLPDLLIGVPAEELDDEASAGLLTIVLGDATAGTVAYAELWHQGVAGFPDAVEAGDAFGSAIRP